MRKFALLLLLAGTASPVLAADGPFDGARERAERRSERASNDDNRPQRSQSVERTRERASRPSNGGEDRSFRRQMRERAPVQQPAPVVVQRQQAEPAVTPQTERRQRDGTFRQQINEAVNGTYVPREREVRTIPGTVTTQHRDRSRDGASRHRGDYSRWTKHWRNDRRYDWRRHRDRNRTTFRVGFYYDPFGYSYRRYGLGSYLYPSYYRSSYWINDPWEYRLPPAYGPYRWVRYYNDALLVDTWTGEVVDVIHGFFW